MSKRKFLALASMIAALLLLLAACGGSDEGSDGASSEGSKLRIAVGPPGSETNNISRKILEAHGLTEDDYQAFQEGFGDAADGVQDGNIDISFGVLGLPAGSIESLQATT